MLADNNNTSSDEIDNEIMCSTVAQEVEIGDEEVTNEDVIEQQGIDEKPPFSENVASPTDYTKPLLPPPMKSECYNGAERENYSWSQTIMDLGKFLNIFL